MSYDIMILDANDEPIDSINIGVDDHFIFFKETDNKNYHLLSRMNDYYEDAQYETDELSDLEEELIRINKKFELNIKINGFIKSFISLVQKAKDKNMIIEGVCD